MNWFFITLGYSGLFPKAPGTVGSLVALILGIPLSAYLGSQLMFTLTLLISAIAVKEINKYEQKSAVHDDKRIVIDELAGMWLALSIAPGVMLDFDNIFNYENGFVIQAILSFVFFRYFDIKKPSIIGRIDKKMTGGLGVMADDIVAGFAAGISSALVWQIILKLQQYFS
ncbi:phosphatidylglycerophosphatase A [Sulfurimonas sp. HSL-1716]|uniref:phosphatidylglycerophosphatase A family protein n=1 Tax=Hydrocurvibacter sulfurireducens TaxID=3131937 RepID=UPI0031F7C276